MKVLFTFGGLPHYYNLVLNRLNAIPDLEIIVVTPNKKSMTFGEGVYQTKNGIEFKHIELEEYKIRNRYIAFKGFASVLVKEKPDIVVAIYPYLHSLVYSIPNLFVMKACGIKTILKDHPFRLPKYDEIKKDFISKSIGSNLTPRVTLKLTMLLEKIFGQNKLPELIHPPILIMAKVLTPLIKLRRKLRIHYELLKKRYFYKLPDALVCYVENAIDIFGSYGVDKQKIFITYNSPDTDMLFAIKDSLMSQKPILPKNEHRIIHVGRLVEWKRVDLLIRAFAKVKKIYDDAELLIIGHGPKQEELKSLSTKLNVEEYVQFLGGVYDPKLFGSYLMASSVYALAGMGGLSINDAMCFGLPIICSVCDGTEKKLVRDAFNGKYFREGDEDDLVEKILYIFSNKKLREEMGRNSSKIIRDEINIHTVINGYIRAFEYVTNEKIVNIQS